MCGFAAMIGLHGAAADPLVIERMAAVLKHRGPDEGGTYLSGAVGLGFRRLSILDLSPTGHQPMVSADGRAVIVFNGEIYNYVELRQELESLGHRFRSSGDTEVLLQAYLQWGSACLPKLNGMWAFLIYDLGRDVIFGSRDRFGVKPLFRYQTHRHVFFASEIKAIRASGHYCHEPDWGTVSEFLFRGRLENVPEPERTFHARVTQVPAGSAFELHLDGRMREWHFWSLDGRRQSAVDDPPREFAELFSDAVRLRLRSDVPVGVSLSGGLDSTSIMCTMAHFGAGARGASGESALQAFSYIAPEFDESQYVADTIRETGAELHKVETDVARLWGSLEKVLWHHDEPIHSLTALVGYAVYGLAAGNGVKVVLSGQGADETIGGYPSYFPDYWYTLLHSGNPAMAWREIGAYGAVHGGAQAALFKDALRRLAGVELRRLPVYRSAVRRREDARLRRNDWFAPELAAQLGSQDERWEGQTLNEVLVRSVERSPLPLYLRIEDRNSMAHSVEARLPFLDFRLVRRVFDLPAAWKIRGQWNKFVLREGMRGRIPESVRSRSDKMGFPTPSRRWFAEELYEYVQDLVARRQTRERGIYDVAAIRRDLERHRKGELDVSSGLFNVSQLECWFDLQSGDC